MTIANIQKPYDISIRGKTIDSKEINELTWKVSGSLQKHYQVDVFRNSDNVNIFSSDKILSYSNRYSMPKDTLENGFEYKVKITVWGENDSTASSDLEIFQTSSRPIITIEVPSVIDTQSYNFEATYEQGELEPLKSWIGYLYDEDRVKIFDSGIRTIEEMDLLVSNLKTETRYFVEFVATSKKGLTGTSGLKEFLVSYIKPEVSISLKAEEIQNAGIQLSWDVIQIIGTADNHSFIDSDLIDVRNGHVKFQEGFSANKDFTLKVWLKEPLKNSEILKLIGKTGVIILKFREKDFLLEKHVNSYMSIYRSESVEPSQEDVDMFNNGEMEYLNSLFVMIQQIGDNMNITAKRV